MRMRRQQALVGHVEAFDHICWEQDQWDSVGLSVFCRFRITKPDPLSDQWHIEDRLELDKCPTGPWKKAMLMSDMRLTTLVDLIVNKHQKEFFDSGGKEMNVLKTSHLASALKAHTTTIYRLLEGVIVDTPFGPIELVLMLDSGCKGIPKFQVKKDILTLHDGRSDRILAELLSEKYGIKMSRRTIAKYRKALKL